MKHPFTRLYTMLLLLGVILVGGIVVFMFTSYGDTPSSPVVLLREVRSLSRLETVSYRMEKIVDVRSGDVGGKIRDFFFGDKLILIATGEVVAGIDLSGLDESHLTITEAQIVLTIPSPQIFHAALDETQTRIYDRTSGILSRPDKDLESHARQQALTQIRAGACEGNILDKANENAVSQITAILRGMGMTQVLVQSTPPGRCM